MALSNITVTESGGAPVVDHVSATLDLNEAVALTGPSAGHLIETAARLRVPTTGEIKFGDRTLENLPNSTLGQNIAYLGGTVYLHGPTVFDAMTYSLKRRSGTSDYTTDIDILEARRTGNSSDDPNVDWIDYAAAGVASADELQKAMLDALNIVEMEDDLYRWGLLQPVRVDTISADSILRARLVVAERLNGSELSMLIERFDPASYNSNASIAENLRFGAAIDTEFSDTALSRNAQMHAVLHQCDLYDRLVEIGRNIGETLLDIFADISADSPLIEQFSFVEATELPNIKVALERNIPSDNDLERLLNLALSYVDVRHRLDVLDETLKAKIVEARKFFHEMIATQKENVIAFYDPETPTSGASLIDNILFGRTSDHLPRARERIEAFIFEVLDREKLLPIILVAGLSYDIGSGGRRLSSSQQQRIGLARALLRRPQVLLLNDALVVIDEMQARRILTRVVGLRRGKATFAALTHPDYATIFDRHIELEDGQSSADEQREDFDTPAGVDSEVAVLAQIPLFANFESATLKLLAFASKRITFAAGQDLFRQGDQADIAYVVISGAAEVIVEGPDGPIIIALIGSNEFVGEMALLSEDTRSATVRATKELIALEITKDLFFRIMHDSPIASTKIMQELARRLRSMTEKITYAHDSPSSH